MANLRTNNLSGEGGINAIRGSVFFNPVDGNNGLDSITVPAGSDFAYGTGDFTFEAYVWMSSFASDTRLIYSQTVSGTNYILFGITTSGEVTAILGHSSSATSTGRSIALNSWNHVAVSRSSGTVKVFVNGVASSGSSITTDLNDQTRIPTIGKYTHSTQLAWKGYISNFRITKGEALYTADFTPPTTELTAGDNTVLLCCQDSDNPLQEATGKTITGYGRYEYLNDTELVTNGSGLTTTGWTNANTSTFTVEDGMIKVTRSGGTGPTSYQTITTVTGQQYTVSANIQHVSGNYADLRVYNGSDSSGTLLKFLRSTGTSTDGNISSTFTAESTSTTLFFVFDDGGNTGKFSQISVKAADRGKQPKVIPPYGVDAGNTFNGAISMNSQDYMYFPTGRTEERGRGRALFGGGETPSQTNSIEFVNVQSMGIAKDFGDFTSTSGDVKGLGSSTRGVFRVDNAPSLLNTLEFITFANTGNATDFGDLVIAVQQRPGASNQTRGIFSGGLFPGSTVHNDMDYITIATAGNATDFGNLSVTRGDTASLASPTRLLIGGGWTPSTSYGDVIDYVTIATTGNAADFGDLNTGKRALTAVASSTRGVFGPGKAPSVSNVIDFVTIASTGNATDFGDALVARGGAGSASNSIRGLFAGGYSPSKINGIEFINIATTGNGADFGDMTFVSQYGGGCSDSHGGIS